MSDQQSVEMASKLRMKIEKIITLKMKMVEIVHEQRNLDISVKEDQFQKLILELKSEVMEL